MNCARLTSAFEMEDPFFIPLEGLLPMNIATRDNASLNEQRILDQSGYKNKSPLPCFFLRGK
jgi:hypothetical protein